MSKTKEKIRKSINKLKQPFMNHVQAQAQAKVQKKYTATVNMHEGFGKLFHFPQVFS